MSEPIDQNEADTDDTHSDHLAHIAKVAAQNTEPILSEPVLASSSGDPVLSEPQMITVNTTNLRLDLACGNAPADGFEGVDIAGSGVKHKVNLLRYPWPWADNSVEELHCSHFMEHIPDIMVDSRDGSAIDPTENSPHAKDALFRFMEECWRVLRPDGRMRVVVPAARHHRGFQDPTHRRFFVLETFYYFHAPSRVAMGIGHYNTWVNFDIVVDWSTDQVFRARSPEYQQQHLQSDWNVLYDYQAFLVKRPRIDLTPDK